MRILFCIIMALTTPIAFGCADFTGTYVFGPNTLAVTQIGCESLILSYADHDESYLLDSVEHEVSRTPQVTTLASASFVKYAPIIRMTVKNFYFTGLQEIYFRRLSLFSAGNKAVLLDELGRFQSSGVFVPYHQISYENILPEGFF